MGEVIKRSISLTRRNAEFLQQQVDSGRFANLSEAIRAGIYLLETEDARLTELRAMIAEGDAQIAAGDGIELTGRKEFVAQIRKKGRSKLASES